MKNEDSLLLSALAKDNEKAFEHLYIKYANSLLQYVGNHIKDKELSENIVQEIFTSIWVRRHSLEIDHNFDYYLKSAAKNKVISHIRAEKNHQKYIEHFQLFIAQYQVDHLENSSHAEELKALILNALQSLPPKCAQAFYLSRFEYKTLDEIAVEMQISKRTAENYNTQALKHLRKMLKDYHWIIAFFFNSWN